jgi:hypothetical protein
MSIALTDLFNEQAGNAITPSGKGNTKKRTFECQVSGDALSSNPSAKTTVNIQFVESQMKKDDFYIRMSQKRIEVLGMLIERNVNVDANTLKRRNCLIQLDADLAVMIAKSRLDCNL